MAKKGLKDQVKEMKETNKGRALLKLMGWSIFFVLVSMVMIIFSFIASNKPNNENIANTPINDKEINKEDESDSSSDINILMPEVMEIENFNAEVLRLKNQEYDYNYEINIGDKKYVFKGHKYSDYREGYKESPEGVIKYLINDEGIFEETSQDKKELEDFYGDINKNYLDLDYLTNIFKGIEFKLDSTELLNYKYYGVRENDKFYVSFDQDTKNLIEIEIDTLEGKYVLTFGGK